MCQLPRYDIVDVAPKSDISELRSEMHALRTRSVIGDGLAAVNQRLDRLFLALVAGLFVVIAIMASVIFKVG